MTTDHAALAKELRRLVVRAAQDHSLPKFSHAFTASRAALVSFIAENATIIVTALEAQGEVRAALEDAGAVQDGDEAAAASGRLFSLLRRVRATTAPQSAEGREDEERERLINALVQAAALMLRSHDLSCEGVSCAISGVDATRAALAEIDAARARRAERDGGE